MSPEPEIVSLFGMAASENVPSQPGMNGILAMVTCKLEPNCMEMIVNSANGIKTVRASDDHPVIFAIMGGNGRDSTLGKVKTLSPEDGLATSGGHGGDILFVISDPQTDDEFIRMHKKSTITFVRVGGKPGRTGAHDAEYFPHATVLPKPEFGHNGTVGIYLPFLTGEESYREVTA